MGEEEGISGVCILLFSLEVLTAQFVLALWECEPLLSVFERIARPSLISSEGAFCLGGHILLYHLVCLHNLCLVFSIICFIHKV